MSNVGRRVRLRKRNHNFPIGSLGTVVAEGKRTVRQVMAYVKLDDCGCNNYENKKDACNGYPYGLGDSLVGDIRGVDGGPHFEWADDEKSRPNADGTCSCVWGHVMAFGCSCGGK